MLPRLLIAAVVAVSSLLALVLGIFSIAGALYEPNTEIPDGLAGTHMVVDGMRLRVLQRGSGRDVLLIHGSPGSIEDWQPVIDALAGSFRLTAFDRPGHGFSGDAGEYSYERNADVALRVIDALNLENVVVAGHSYGGAAALAMAVRDPVAVSAYVIVDAAAYEPSREAGGAYRLLALPWLGMGVARVVGPFGADRRIERGIADVSVHEPDRAFVALRTRIWSSPKVMHALANEMTGARAGLLQLSPKYARIRRPTSVLMQADDAFRSATGKRLQRDIPGSNLTLVSGTGHYIQFDQPSAVVDAIRRVAEPQKPLAM